MQLEYLKDFRESSNGKAWHELVASNWFQEGLKTALATFQVPVAQDMGTAAANWYRIQGAQMFIQHLMNLTETPKPKTPDQTGMLKRT